MRQKKKIYTVEECLELIFSLVSRTSMTKEDFNKYWSYKYRYRDGKLGREAQLRILEENGFTISIQVTKQRKDINNVEDKTL